MIKKSSKKYVLRDNHYRPEIDGLRAFAVVTVIINHFNKDILPGGYLGVDIFFVISGYVITSSLFRRPNKNFADFISGFYARRIKRLIPALAFFVIIISVAICFFNPQPINTLRTGITSLFGLSNLYLFKHSIDYFADSTDLNTFTHTWSLGVEEQFYLIFPFLIWFSGYRKQAKNVIRNLLLIIGGLTFISLISFIYLYKTNQPAAYFLMPSRFWEMASGCLLFLGIQKSESFKNLLEKIPPLLLLTLIIVVMNLPTYWAEISTILIVILTSILIISLKKPTSAFKLFTNPKVTYIGLISYSLYLWHWGVIAISRWTIGIHFWSIPFQIAIIFSLAVFSYQFFEKPFRKGIWPNKNWQTLVLSGGFIFTLSGTLWKFSEPLKQQLYLGTRSNCIPLEYETCSPNNFPHRATTPFIRGTAITRKECFKYNGPLNKIIIDKCRISSKLEKSPTIFLTGSSYTHSLSPVFEDLRNEFGIGISMLLKGGCDLDPLLIQENLDLTCKNTNKERNSYISKFVRPGDIIFSVPSNKIDLVSVEEIAKVALEKKIDVVIFSPIPVWKRLETGQDVLCQRYKPDSEWFRRKGVMNCGIYSEMSRELFDKQNSKRIDLLKKIEKNNPFFHVFRVDEILCDSSKCPSHIKGVRLYRNNKAHISLPAVKKYFIDEIRTFLLQRNLLSIRE